MPELTGRKRKAPVGGGTPEEAGQRPAKSKRLGSVKV